MLIWYVKFWSLEPLQKPQIDGSKNRLNNVSVAYPFLTSGN